MPRGPYPALLMLAMALPGAARALGLGDIRVNSALNEPLSAQIDLVGATPEELATLTAQLADEAMFQRYGADRPSYLSTVRFKVAMNSQGLPVLEVRSAVPFADPIVNFLVDIRWPKGELIRDYSLLLDPAVFAQGTRLDAAAVVTSGLAMQTPAAVIASPSAAPPAQVTLPASPAPAATLTFDTAITVPPVSDSGSVYRVLARDTLYDIVRRAGAVTEAEKLQMMIAVFRANPDAFDRNINILHRGAVLTMPSAKDVESVDAAEARRSVAKQMRAWRLYGTGADFRPAGSGLIALPPSVQGQVESARMELLNSRVQSLELALEAEQRQVAGMKATIQELKQPAALPPNKPSAEAAKASPRQVVARVGARFSALLLSSMALVLGLPLLGLAMLRRRRRQSAPTPRPAHEPDFARAMQRDSSSGSIQGSGADQPDVPASTVEMKAPDDSPGSPRPGDDDTIASPEPDTLLLEQLEADYAAAAVSMVDTQGQASTANDTTEMAAAILDGAVTEEAILTAVAEQVAEQRLNTTLLDYNLVDLDSKAPHVHLPSELNDRQLFVERRTSVIEALRAAIERDPLRRDLCMKLLETYHSTASANRRAFAEFVRLRAGGPNSLSAEDWQRIAKMGRELALDEGLLVNPGDDDLANCA